MTDSGMKIKVIAPDDIIPPVIITGGVCAIATQIVTDFAAAKLENPELSNRLTLVGVLEGGVPFTVDLARALEGLFLGNYIVDVQWIGATSYEGYESSDVMITYMPKKIEDSAYVVIADDILDSGKTLTYIRDFIEAEYKPASVLTAVAVQKSAFATDRFDRPVIQEADYVAVDLACPLVGKLFLVGYGLDDNGGSRYVSYIRFIEKDPPSDS